ncbi:unnamed protein product [Ascophyllum nodosum]
MRVLTLLSPAKTLNWNPPPASLAELWTQPRSLREADPVVKIMRDKSKSELKKLMAVSDSIADLNNKRFKDFIGADDIGQAKAEDIMRPAALAYDGPAYRGLDAKTFSQEEWAFGAGCIRLLSGLYGVLRPTDLIQPYRLEMGSRVQVDGKRDLYEYWKDSITQSLLEDVRDASSQEGFLVVNVASQEYSKAVDFGKLEEAGGKVVTCVFKDDGRVLSVFAKRARGLFARHLVVSRARSAADLEAFSAEGYRLDRSQCADDVLVFSRSKSQRIPPQPQATTSASNGKKKRAVPASASAAASKKAISSAKASSPNVVHNAARKTKSSKGGRKKS